jgi:glycosyltransferase involved in cell wall biosynthesis
MRLTLIMPAHNERATIGTILCRVSEALPDVPKEVVIVDDRSTDGTTGWLQANIPGGRRAAGRFALDAAGALLDGEGGVETELRVLHHARNRGKGAAIRTGLAAATGTMVAIQDADLEYDPADLAPMVDLIARKRVADVVYGSRFYGRPHRSLYFHHYVANRTISLIFNVLYNQTLTDIECCYKVMTIEVARALRLTADDFGIEIEIGAGVARRRGLRIYETGISYYGRSYDEGKKIGWRDGVKAFWYLVKYRFTPVAASPSARPC